MLSLVVRLNGHHGENEGEQRKDRRLNETHERLQAVEHDRKDERGRNDMNRNQHVAREDVAEQTKGETDDTNQLAELSSTPTKMLIGLNLANGGKAKNFPKYLKPARNAPGSTKTKDQNAIASGLLQRRCSRCAGTGELTSRVGLVGVGQRPDRPPSPAGAGLDDVRAADFVRDDAGRLVLLCDAPRRSS